MSAATSRGAACGRRALITLAAALVAAVALLTGWVGGASATSLASIATTTTIGVSPTSATTSDTVTFTATVTAASGAAPTGSVEFDAHFTAQGATSGSDIEIGSANLTPGSGSSSTATLSRTGMQAGTYQVTGSYNPNGSIAWSTSTSAVTSLSVGSVLNQVTMSFALSSQTITAGQSVTFSTTVSGPAGQPTPTGTVAFTAGSNVTDQAVLPGGSVQLVNGVATATIGGWQAGTYIVAADYQGDALYVSSPSTSLTLTVNPVSQAVTTTTSVTLSPTSIATGALVRIQAHVQQVGTQLPPPSGELVRLTVGPVGGDPAQAIPLQGFQAVPLDANGNIDVTTGGWMAGDWVVYAGYVGDVLDAASTGTATLHVTQPANGSSVSYTGATSATWGGAATLSGHLADTSGNPIAGETLTFSMGNDTCSGTTDSNGNVTCQVTITGSLGSHTVTVAFAGDTTYQAASKDTLFTVDGVTTTTTYTGATTGGTGQSVTLSAHLVRTDTSAALAGETVALTMGAESCSAQTNASGNASCAVTVSEGSGSYPIAATFGGDGGYLASGASGSFTVAAQSTTTSTADVTAYVGAATTFSATLASNGSPVAGKAIAIVAGTQTCTGTTDGTGTATCSITLDEGAGQYTITASFAGDAGFLASSGTGKLTIATIPTTTTYTGAVQASAGSSVTLSAHLVDVSGNALAAKTVTITLGTQSCSAVTDASGDASCSITLNQAGGTYQVTAAFAGDATYAASTVSKSFTISSSTKPTIVKILPVAPVLQGSAVQLTGILFSGILPVGGKTLTLSLGSESCTAKTNILGVASCSVTASDPPGQVQAKAAFAGDSTYQAAFDTTTVVIYAFAPGGGSFVVGDRSDTGSVTFWGAQWSKANSLSGGSAPSSFKGFAVSPATPQCGGTWSTDPGNSAPPPAGPLPAYMAVVVTSSTSKSGSKISGTVVAIVLVKVDAGYQPNPGRAGTGTVVATLCKAGDTKGGNGRGGGGDDRHGGNDQGDGKGGGRCPSFGF